MNNSTHRKKKHLKAKIIEYKLSVFCFLILFILLLPKYTHAESEKSSSDSLKEIIELEFLKFQSVAKTNNIILGKIVYSETENSHVNADNNIVINLKQIEKYTKYTSYDFKSLFAKFVIAHELGHKIQKNSFKKEVILSSKGESILFLECNADILAGILTSQVFETVEVIELRKKDPNFDPNIYNIQKSSVTFEVYKRIFEMDNRNAISKTHPSNEDRLMAVRTGLLAGHIWTFYFSINQPDPSVKLPPINELNRLKELYNNFSKAIDFNPYDRNNNNIYTWAHSEAIRIVNENNSMANNLIIFDNQVDWNKSSDNPIVNFSFKALNNNSNTINFNGRVFTELIPRNDTKNIIKSAPVDGYAFNKVIAPHDTIVISGQLNWAADKDYMPHIIVPGDSRSLYWVFDQSNPKVDTVDFENIKINFQEWSPESKNRLVDLINKVLENKDILLNCRKGVGISTARNTNQIEKRGVNYIPLFMSNKEEEQTVYLKQNGDKIKFVIDVFNWNDENVAKDCFEQVNDAVKQSLGQDYMPSETKIIGKIKYVNYTLNNKRVLRITLNYDSLDKYSYITVEIM